MTKFIVKNQTLECHFDVIKSTSKGQLDKNYYILVYTSECNDTKYSTTKLKCYPIRFNVNYCLGVLVDYMFITATHSVIYNGKKI